MKINEALKIMLNYSDYDPDDIEWQKAFNEITEALGVFYEKRSGNFACRLSPGGPRGDPAEHCQKNESRVQREDLCAVGPPVRALRVTHIVWRWRRAICRQRIAVHCHHDERHT